MTLFHEYIGMKKHILSIVSIVLTLCALPAYSLITPEYTSADFGFKGPVKTVSSSHVSTKYFDDKGNPVSSFIESYTFDKAGRATTIIKDIDGSTNEYAYDNYGHIERITTTRKYGGRILKFKYRGDKLARQEMYRPDGVTLYSYCDYTYSPEGDIIACNSVMVDKDKKETPEGSVSISYLYNTSVMTMLTPDGKPWIILSYNKNRSEKEPDEVTMYDRKTGEKTAIVMNVYNENGKLAKSINMDGRGRKISTTEIKYDTDGNEILRVKTGTDSTVSTITTTRDIFGNPLIVTDSSNPENKTVYTYTYY